jgi:tRNA pseudouridine38-40 synthase
MRYAARVGYMGTADSGWQRQAMGTGVQEKIEESLAALEGKPVTVTAAGRTDAGVHACGQVISFELEKQWRPDKLVLAANFRLPPDISVLETARVLPGFDARRHALWREYRFFIWHGNALPPFLHGRVWWNRFRWDFEEVRRACALFEGDHDFRAFCKTAECPERTVRTIHTASVTRKGRLAVFTVRGNAFLTNMVRIMAGNLNAVGRGKKSVEWLKSLLGGQAREHSAMTAPAEGLYLWKVGYGEGTPFGPYRVE